MLNKSLSLISGVLFTLASSSAIADVSSDLNHFVDSLGFSAKVNNAASYNTQAAGYVTMGSIYARNTVRDIQIMHVDVPGVRSGCGGIDLTAGGFSFIKGPELVKFMQNILSNGAGYALNLALEVELPEIAHAMQYMQKIAQEINSGNFNSCEMSEDLIGGLWPKSRASQQQVCQDIGTHSGAFTDWAAARQGCSTGSDYDDQTNKAKNDPKYKYRVYKDTNIIWDRVVMRNDFLSSDEKLGELYMTISGTIVFDKNSSITTYPSKVDNANFIKALLYGGKVPTYICKDDGKKCLDVDYSPSTFQNISLNGALVPHVENLLNDIYTRIKTNQKLTDQEVGLITLTQSPVFAVISSNAQMNVGTFGLKSFAEMVATDILSDYLKNVITVIQTSMSGTQLDKNNVQNLIDSIQKARRFIDQFDMQTRARFEQALAINQGVQNMVSHAFRDLSPVLRQAVEEQN